MKSFPMEKPRGRTRTNSLNGMVYRIEKVAFNLTTFHSELTNKQNTLMKTSAWKKFIFNDYYRVDRELEIRRGLLEV